MAQLVNALQLRLVPSVRRRHCHARTPVRQKRTNVIVWGSSVKSKKIRCYDN